MSQPKKVICPDCGVEMNHHAMKVDYGVDGPALVDNLFGGAPRSFEFRVSGCGFRVPSELEAGSFGSENVKVGT